MQPVPLQDDFTPLQTAVDRTVIIKEVDGSEQRFIKPFSSVPIFSVKAISEIALPQVNIRRELPQRLAAFRQLIRIMVYRGG
ncbi:hypothetical protein ACLB1R_25295 [Escherichia coli]